MISMAEAFQSLSEGRPLVLTYTFMKLIRDHRVLSATLVRKNDPAPYGDVRAYYKSLWQRLSWDAKDALHLIAEDNFIWPSGALERCLRLEKVNLEAEVGHLLATVDAGIRAFHGSLYVFISQQPDHQIRLESLLPKVEGWLDNQAPPYLRWGWLLLYESRWGEQTGLLRHDVVSANWRLIANLTGQHPRPEQCVSFYSWACCSATAQISQAGILSALHELIAVKRWKLDLSP